jgi:hypothetical protein
MGEQKRKMQGICQLCTGMYVEILSLFSLSFFCLAYISPDNNTIVVIYQLCIWSRIVMTATLGRV